MNNTRRLWFGLLALMFILVVTGCGSDDNGRPLIRMELANLGRLTGPFQYAAWVQTTDRTVLLDTFNTGLDNRITFSRFALLDTLLPGDRIFVTIESDPIPSPFTPSRRVVLDGTIAGDSAVLRFPRMLEFQNATGFATVSLGNDQLLTEFTNLPDVSDLGFVYQGFLVRDGNITPLRRFRFNEVPVSDTAPFNITTAQYILSIEPEPDFAPQSPYTIQPFFTNGTLQPLIRQPLVRSPLTPNEPNFRFPFGVAVLR